MKISALTPNNILLDGQPSGGFIAAAIAHPELAEALQATLDAWIAATESRLAPELERVREASALEIARLNKQLADARAEIDVLCARLEPKPLPAYFLVIPLQAPIGSAGHAGIRRPPAIGGAWEFDLLHETSPEQFVLVKSGLTAPANARLTSFSELTAEQAATDIAASLGVETKG